MQSSAITLDVEVLKGIQAMVPDNPTFINVVIDAFTSSAPPSLVSIAEAIDKNDPEALWRAAHKLKGTAGGVGAMKLMELCATLNDIGKAGRMGNASELYAELEVELRTVTEILEKQWRRA